MLHGNINVYCTVSIAVQ